MSDADLLEQFVRSFQATYLIARETVPPELDGGLDDSRWARQLWKPAKISTDHSALALLYSRLPGRLPPLYEQLVLSYRWLEVEVDDAFRLLGNPPGPTLQALLENIAADPVFVEVLFPLGLIPFGRGSGEIYDPWCFDSMRRGCDGDCPIVRAEHEAVLCELRLGETSQVAPSFRQLMQRV